MNTKKLIKSQKRNKHPWRRFNPFLFSDFYSEDQKRVVANNKDTSNETRNNR